MRLAGVQDQTVGIDPTADFRQGSLGLLAALAQNHEVVGIPSASAMGAFSICCAAG
jgi:hypothetical protein